MYPSAAFQARALASFVHAQGWSRVFVVFSQVTRGVRTIQPDDHPLPYSLSMFYFPVIFHILRLLHRIVFSFLSEQFWQRFSDRVY